MTYPARTFVHVEGPRPKRAPPPQRARALAYIKSEVAAGRPFPTHTQITKHMCWRKEGSASHCLEGLRHDGHVTAKLKRSVKGGTYREWSLAP